MTDLSPENTNQFNSQMGNYSEAADNLGAEACLQAVVNSLPAIVWATDLAGTIAFIIGSGLDALGLKSEELVGQSIFVLYKAHSGNVENIKRGLSGEQRAWISTFHNVIYNHRVIPVRDRNGNAIGLTGVSLDITERDRVETALRQQARRERLVATIAQRIRASLQLNDILNTTVAELRQFLQINRMVIYRFSQEERGIVVAESADPEYSANLDANVDNLSVDIRCLGESIEAYSRGEFHVIHDVEVASLSAETQQFLKQRYVKSRLAVPILVDGEEEGSPLPSNCARPWGLLVADHCAQVHHWHPQEINLLASLSTQVAIAIRQAQLYAKLEENKRQLEESNKELLRLASVDWLTQTANRLRFDEYINQEWRQMAREGAQIALIMADIDYFKDYNDTYGHPEGDRCLQKVARAINQTVKRPRDLVARYGGEEFAIVLPMTDIEGANYLAEQIRTNVKALNIVHEESLIDEYVTVSLGVASMSPIVGSTPSVLIAAADYALYEAKGRGRNCIYSIG
ncbi:diguanylate cyclase domain-containing protein [Pseudanabaena sp. PCC 6802]|uniref:diguanylate cyclase domain-containing protein n=1 Tax=Pseudanabaena sp. PCC 6802 TaxID=118173 RepID=UPI000348B409|nr:diguanylate cyclase [Pseudanabaena sp. PCC 6802]